LLGASNPGVTTESKMTSSLAVSSERGGKPAEELTHDPAHKTRSTCCLPRQPRLELRASLEPALGVRGVCGRVQARRRARSGALASHKHQGTPQHPWPWPHFLLWCAPALASPGRRPSDARAASLGGALGGKSHKSSTDSPVLFLP
jgi:hypothetical protein